MSQISLLFKKNAPYYKGAQRKTMRLPLQEAWFGSLGRKEPLEKEIADHSSIPAWEIPWTEEPGSPWGRKNLHMT